MAPPAAEPEVKVHDLAAIKVATLNRPQALNAVNGSMVARLTELYSR